MTQNKTLNYWNKNPTRGQWKSFKTEASKIYKKEHWMKQEIDKINLKNKKTLDAGCGQGLNLWYLLENGADAQGIDFAQKAVEETKRKLSQTRYSASIVEVGDVQNLRFEKNTFDIVICFGVLHHITSIEKGLTELNRVLKTRGEIVVMVYNKNSLQFKILKTIRILGRTLYKVLKPNKKKAYGTFWDELLLTPILNTYSQRELKKLFEKSGFENIVFERTFTGLTRIPDFLNFTKKYFKIFNYLDIKLKKTFGAYTMVYANKKEDLK